MLHLVVAPLPVFAKKMKPKLKINQVLVSDFPLSYSRMVVFMAVAYT